MFHISKKYSRRFGRLYKKFSKRPLNQYERTNAMYEKYRIIPPDGESSHLEKFIVTALNICIYKQIHNL